MPDIPLQPVMNPSKMIAAAGYDPDSRTLRIQFHAGRVYDYHDVDPGEYDAFSTSASHGNTFNTLFRGKKPCKQIDDVDD